MKRLLPTLALLGILLIVAQAEAKPHAACAHSGRGWELNDGGKQCRTMAMAFKRAVRQDGRIRPTATGCHTSKPWRIWWCSASRYRTMNMEGDFARGKIYRSGKRWKIGKIRYPSW